MPLFQDIATLPRYVKRRSKEEQERWMSIWNDTFTAENSENAAYRAANGALSLSVPWESFRSHAEETRTFPLVKCFVSDVFPDWDAAGIYQVQVMRTGLWKDHPEYGDILITKDDLVDAVRNYRDFPRKLFLDDDHGITDPSGSANPGKSFGWVRDLWIETHSGERLEPEAVKESKATGFVLRAEYEVNEHGNAWLKDKTKALYSPTFAPVYYNKETGEIQGMTLLGGAMTNTPYFDGMDGFTAVAATDPVAKALRTKIGPHSANTVTTTVANLGSFTFTPTIATYGTNWTPKTSGFVNVLEWSEPPIEEKTPETTPEPQPVPAEKKSEVMDLGAMLLSKTSQA
jgi:hypothetical protein